MKAFIITLLLSAPHFSLLADSLPDVVSPSATQTPRASAIDKTYQYLNSTFSMPAIWFDQFFDDQRIAEDAHSNTRVKWYNDIYWDEFGEINYQTKLNARVYLPNVTHRLKLIYESDDEQSLPENFNEQQSDSNQLGLSYDVANKGHSNFALKATIRPSIELRYRYNYAITAETSLSFIQKIYQKRGLTGESTQLDTDYAIKPKVFLRLSNWIKWETDIKAFKTGSSLTFYQYISEKKAINYSAGFSQKHTPYSYIDNSFVGLTYRQNILKKWLFYEIKPRLDWDKDPNESPQRDANITLRIEILFTGV